VSETELERIRDAYRARDSESDSAYRWDNPRYVAHVQALERALLQAFGDAGVQLAGARVLDVGCGGGYLLHRLQEYGAGECRGIDLMENRIAEGRERYPTLKLEVGSATELPYADGEVDLVTQFTCLSSIVDGDVRLAVAREMRRVARGWILSYDLRGLSLGPLRRRREETPVVPLDDAELRRLFGEPTLLRSTGLPLELARHRILAALPPLRSHLLGIWRQGSW
jgi:SAM-dependent methyltransferase